MPFRGIISYLSFPFFRVLRLFCFRAFRQGHGGRYAGCHKTFGVLYGDIFTWSAGYLLWAEKAFAGFARGTAVVSRKALPGYD